MDEVLVEYLNSGQAWLLVGSGPSIAMGYPSWEALAETASRLIAKESSPESRQEAQAALEARDYPSVFDVAVAAVGYDRLLEVLRASFTPTSSQSEIYAAIARWPIANYLTTNYDSEIDRHLALERVPYREYGNSLEHMSLLVADTTGAIVKLHGDLTTSRGLVLTSASYRDLAQGATFEYWRSRLTSIFQMHQVIILGHSLADPHIRAILETAKRTSTLARQICWIAPGARTTEAKHYLENYKIRVVGYPSYEGDHGGLTAVVKAISQFVIPREDVRIRSDVAEVVRAGEGGEPAATAVYVFNKLAPSVDPNVLRTDVAFASLESAIPRLSKDRAFSVQEALATVDWPAELVDSELAKAIHRRARRSKYFVADGDRLRVASDLPESLYFRVQFEHLRDRFLRALELRALKVPGISPAQARGIANAINGSLTGFFRKGGLTLASLLFSQGNGRRPALPSSILGFIAEASAQFDDMSSRLAFWQTAISAFVESTDAERNYLGRLAQGFFAFHALGTFGDSAAAAIRNARDTVWVVDSSLQIPALAVAAPSCLAYASTFERLRDRGVRLFSSGKLFSETVDHLGFANQLVRKVGSDSPYVVAAANGSTPYSNRRNVFLQGFIQWQAAGNPGDWSSYLYAAFGTRTFDRGAVFRRLQDLGVQTIDIADWPGFSEADFAERDALTESIKTAMRRHRPATSPHDMAFEDYLEVKIPPEGEAVLAVSKERAGKYHVLSQPGQASPSWFVSATSIVNLVDRNVQYTWPPDGFLAFAATLVPSSDARASDRAFEAVLWRLAESGLNPISQQAIEAAFGTVMDQGLLKLAEQEEELHAVLGDRYSEKPSEILKRLPPSQRLLGTLQASKDASRKQLKLMKELQDTGMADARRAREAEAQVDALARFRRKLADRQALNARRKRQNPSRSRGGRQTPRRS